MIVLQKPSNLPKDYDAWFKKLQKVMNEKNFYEIGVYAKKLESFSSEELWRVTLNNMKTIRINKGTK